MLIAIAIFFVFPSKTLLAQKLDYLKWYSPLSSGAEGFPRVSVLSTPRMEVRAFKYCNYGSGLNPVRNSYELERGFYNALSKFVWESKFPQLESGTYGEYQGFPAVVVWAISVKYKGQPTPTTVIAIRGSSRVSSRHRPIPEEYWTVHNYIENTWLRRLINC
jgi:hypothetical protein